MYAVLPLAVFLAGGRAISHAAVHFPALEEFLR
jgi:hypothetical protein